ncbi:MAG: 3-hydroxyacyl-CoA dehydrogenase [Proteobacteria bacterium]|nr:3-hydroxyacyl-CoA dehydrogenase [Pseudomonadota bacterium]
MSDVIIEFIVLDLVSGRVIVCDQNGRKINTLKQGLSSAPDGVFIDRAKHHIYVTMMGTVDQATGTAYGQDGSIWRMDLDGSNVVNIIPKGKSRTPKQMTADLEGGKIYWCDREGMTVWRANLDGSDMEALYRSGHVPEDEKDAARWCVGIAVDPKRRQFYWTQKGETDAGQGSIHRASYDMPEGGTPERRGDVERLFSGLPEPIDLELDFEHGYLYWTDRGNLKGGNSLCRARLLADGAVARDYEVVVAGVGEAIASVLVPERNQAYITSLTGDLFLADLTTGTVRSIAKFDGLTGIARL